MREYYMDRVMEIVQQHLQSTTSGYVDELEKEFRGQGVKLRDLKSSADHKNE